jgi:hypothetical protein
LRVTPLDRLCVMVLNMGMTVRKGERCVVLGEVRWGVCLWSNPIKHTVCIQYADGTTVIVRSDSVLY